MPKADVRHFGQVRPDGRGLHFLATGVPPPIHEPSCPLLHAKKQTCCFPWRAVSARNPMSYGFFRFPKRVHVLKNRRRSLQEFRLEFCPPSRSPLKSHIRSQPRAFRQQQNILSTTVQAVSYRLREFRGLWATLKKVVRICLRRTPLKIPQNSSGTFASDSPSRRGRIYFPFSRRHLKASPHKPHEARACFRRSI